MAFYILHQTSARLVQTADPHGRPRLLRDRRAQPALLSLASVALTMLVCDCAESRVRLTEKDLYRVYDVTYATGKPAVLAELDMVSKRISDGNPIADKKQHCNPARGHVGFAMQVGVRNPAAPDLYKYSVDIEVYDKNYKVIFMLWPEADPSPPSGTSLSSADLAEIYPIWARVAAEIAHATGGTAVFVPSTPANPYPEFTSAGPDR